VQRLWTWALPLALLAFARWVERPSPGLAALVATLVLVQALSGWYLAVDIALLLLVAAPVLMWRRRLTLRHVLSGGLAMAVALPIVSVFAGPYTHLAGPSREEVAGFSADIASYLVPPENTWLGQLAASHTTLAPRWIWGEQTLYVGGVTLALAALGLWGWRTRRDRLTAATLVAGGLALTLSFGPGAGWSPFDLFTALPAMSLLRAPGRFALLVMLTLALLVALGVACLRSGKSRWTPAVLTVLALVGLSESYIVGFPGGKPPRMPVPEVYQRLKTLPPGAVLSLPTYRFAPDNFREADYLLFSTAHWYPTVNGYGRRRSTRRTARCACRRSRTSRSRDGSGRSSSTS
jgi:hypothetical protein